MAVTRKFSRILLWSLVAIIVLLVALRLLAPQLIKQGIVSWFDEQQLQAKVEEIDIDLSNGQFAIRGITANKQETQVLKLDDVSVGWSWSGLFSSEARVKSIKLDGLAFGVEKTEDGNLIVAGLDINKLSQPPADAETTPDDAEQEPLDWKVFLDELLLSNFDICYRESNQDYCNRFDKLSWQGELMVDLAKLANPALPIFAKGKFTIDALQVHDNVLDRDLAKFEQFSIDGIDIDSFNSVGLADLALSDFNFCFKQSDQDHCGHFDKLGWQGDLKADLSQAEGPPPVNAKGRFEINALQVRDNIQDTDLATFEQFSIEGIDIATLESVGISNLTLADFSFCYKQPDQDYCSHFDKLAWQGNLKANLSKLDGTPPPITAKGSFGIDALQVHNNTLNRDLATIDQLSVEEIDIASLDSIAFKTLSLTPLTLLKRSEDKLAPQITRFEKIQLDNVALKKLQKLSIDQVTIKDHEMFLVNNADKTLELQEWLPAQSTSEEPVTDESTDEPTEQSGSFQYAINKFVYETSKSIQYRDNSLKKPFAVDLNTIKLTLENLDSSKPEQDSNISYSAQIGKHGNISFDGTAKPLMAKPSFDMAGKIAGLDLRDLSPFTGDAIGHTIKSGQLDADLKMLADNSVLDSEVDLKLYHFELTALSPEDEEKLNADFGYPLNSSLDLLKDSDNSIELNIPITGDLQNPDFNANDAITQATSSAITSAILSYYTPFGLVMLVEGVIDLATALDFEPARFAAGENILEASEHEGLTKLAKLMQEKPGIHLTLCAFSNSADRAIIFPDTVAIPPDELKLEPVQIDKLVELGETRSTAVKEYLVNQKIEASRLVLCSPVHDEGEGLSGVEISI